MDTHSRTPGAAIAVLVIPIPPSLILNENQRLNRWDKAERVKALKGLGIVYTLQQRHPPMEAAHCLAEIAWPNAQRRDAHNLLPTLKALIDGVVHAKLLPDDNDKYLTGPDMRCVVGPDWQVNGKTPTGRMVRLVTVRLTFTPRTPGDAA